MKDFFGEREVKDDSDNFSELQARLCRRSKILAIDLCKGVRRVKYCIAFSSALGLMMIKGTSAFTNGGAALDSALFLTVMEMIEFACGIFFVYTVFFDKGVGEFLYRQRVGKKWAGKATGNYSAYRK